MSDFSLLTTTTEKHVDTVIGGLVGIYELVFPGRVRSYFIMGSHTDNTAVSLSDVDLYIVFKANFRDAAERELAQQLARQCGRLSTVRLDVVPRSEADFATEHSVMLTALKKGSLLMYGEDIRDQIPLPDVDAFTKDVTDGALHFIAKIMRGVDQVALPLNYPDPEGEFYGYDYKRISAWYPATIHSGTKELVSLVGRISTAIIALKAGYLTGSKREGIKKYHELVGDHWGGVIDSVYEHCKMRNRYMISQEEDERRELRALCEDVLALENHYMALYRAYLEALAVRGDADSVTFATERLAKLGIVQGGV